MKIGIVVGSIREGRKGAAVADWVVAGTRNAEGAEFEVLDLKDFNLPLLTSATLPAMANRNYDSDEVTRWSQAVDGCDGFIFITAEYNFGMPGAFKNAVDSLGPEWTRKPVAFVSYGGNNGTRATAQWRQVLANFEMYDIRTTVALSLYDDFNADGYAPGDRRAGELDALVQELIPVTAKLLS